MRLSRLRRTCGLCALALFLAGSAASVAQAAVPRIIIIDGAGLSDRVVMDNWDENGRFVSAVARGLVVPSRDLRSRDFLQVGFLWGAGWNVNLAKRVAIQDVQHGRFYPALAGKAAVVQLPGEGARVAAPQVLNILERHGVDITTKPDQSRWVVWVAPIAAGALVFLAVLSLVVRRRGPHASAPTDTDHVASSDTQ